MTSQGLYGVFLIIGKKSTFEYRLKSVRPAISHIRLAFVQSEVSRSSPPPQFYEKLLRARHCVPLLLAIVLLETA